MPLTATTDRDAACTCGSPFCALRMRRGLQAFCAMPSPVGCGCGSSYGIQAHSIRRHLPGCTRFAAVTR